MISERLRRLHRWLVPRLFYPLLAASLLAMALYLSERALRGWHGPRLHLNLFLAWLPYLFALWAALVHARYPHSRRRLIIPIVLWFFFFPNAPYLVTDYLYLTSIEGTVWQRILIFTSFSFCGLMLAVVSLYQIHMLLLGRIKPLTAWLIVLAVAMFAGLGIYLGRFLRWNSWDLLTRPGAVVRDTLAAIGTPVQGIFPLVFAIIFAALLIVFYSTFVAIRTTQATPEELEGTLIDTFVGNEPPDAG